VLRLKRRKNQIDTLDPIVGQLQLYFCLVSCTRNQGPKLTLLGRRQLTTEFFFFSRHMEKCGRQSVNKILELFFCKKNTS